MAAAAPNIPPTGRGLRNAVTALRYPDYAKFWSGALISNCGTWMQNVTVPYVIYQATKSGVLVGLAGFSQFIPIVFIGPIGGWMADRHPRRSVLITTQTAQGVIAAAMWAAYVAGFRSAGVLIGLVFLTGVVQGLNVPAWQAFVGELVPRSALLNAVTLNSAQFNAARAVGPAIAGAVLAGLGPQWAFLLNALSYAAVVIALVAIAPRPNPGTTADARQPFRKQMATSIEYVRSTPGIVAAISFVGIGAAFGQPLFQLMPVIAARVFHAQAWRFGLMAGAIGFGGVIGAVVLGAFGDGFRRSVLVRRSLLLYTCMLFAVALAPTYGVVVVALLGAGAMYLIYNAPLNTTVQLQAGEHVRGGVFALYIMIFNISYPIGSLVEGWLADVIGARATVFASAVATGCGFLVAVNRRLFAPLDDDEPPGDGDRAGRRRSGPRRSRRGCARPASEEGAVAQRRAADVSPRR